MPFSSLLDPGTYSIVTLAIVTVAFCVCVFWFFVCGVFLRKKILKNNFNVPVFITKTLF